MVLYGNYDMLGCIINVYNIINLIIIINKDIIQIDYLIVVRFWLGVSHSNNIKLVE